MITNMQNNNTQIFILSAKRKEDLQDLINIYIDYLSNTSDKWEDIVYTLNTCREHWIYKLVVLASDKESAIKQLTEQKYFAENNEKTNNISEIAFMFSGQGVKLKNCGKTLYNTQPVFKQSLDECAAIIKEHTNFDLINTLYNSELNNDILIQPALFSIEYALAKLWASWGIIPQFVIGHSVGEYTAAVIAGVMTLNDGLKLLVTRNILMNKLPSNGAMMAINAGLESVNKIINENNLSQKLNIAGINSNMQTIISGEVGCFDKVKLILDSENIKYKVLDVTHAFHSYLMQPMIAEFREIAETIKYTNPTITLISNVTGTELDIKSINAEYWSEHILNPVNYVAGIEALLDIGCRTYLEVGPQQNLIYLTRQIILSNKNRTSDKNNANPYLTSYSLSPEIDDNYSMLENLAMLYAAGCSVNWQQFYAPTKPQRKKVDLPLYPLKKIKYWVDDSVNERIQHDANNQFIYKNEAVVAQVKQNYSPMYNKFHRVDNSHYTLELNPSDSLVRDHKINGRNLLPATAYIDLAIKCYQDLHQKHDVDGIIELYNAHIINPIDCTSDPKLIKIDVGARDDGVKINFSIIDMQNKTINTCSVNAKFNISVFNYKTLQLDAVLSRMKLFENINYMYDSFKSRNYVYGESFRVIDKLYYSENDNDLLVILREDIEELSDSNISPYILDAALHGIVTLYPKSINDKALLPIGFDRVILFKYNPRVRYAHVVKINNALRHEQKFDMNLFDANYNLVCRVEGFTYQIIENEGELLHQKSLADNYFGEFEWIKYAAADSVDDSLNKKEQKLLYVWDLPKKISSDLSESLAFMNIVDIDKLYDITDSSQRVVLNVFGYIDLSCSELDVVAIEGRYKVFSNVFQKIFSTNTNIEIKVLLCCINSSDHMDVELLGYHGVLQTLKLEYPNLFFKIISFANSAELSAYIKVEILNMASSHSAIRYSDKQRYVRNLVFKHSDKLELTNYIHNDATYLVTGGSGAIAQKIVKMLIKLHNATVILVSRATEDEINRIYGDKLIANIKHYQVDVCNEENVSNMFVDLSQKSINLKGILHLAGVIKDDFFINKKIEASYEVIEPKILGAILLDKYSAKLQLDFFIAFSSFTGVVGNLGQSDYAFANALLDNFLFLRQSMVNDNLRFGKTLSIDWPYWKSGGMSISAEKILYLNKLGFESISDDEGLGFLSKAMNLKSTVVAYVKLNKDKLLPLTDFINLNHDLTRKIEAKIVSFDEVTSDIKDIISAVTKIPTNQIHSDSNFVDFGINSLLVIELNDKLEERYGVLPKTILFEFNNVAQLSKYIFDVISKSDIHDEKLDYTQISRINAVSLQAKIPIQQDRKVKEIRETLERNESDDIAIIGLSGIYPQAKNLDEFWDNLLQGKDSITVIPQNRWNHDQLSKLDESHAYSKFGSFIDDYDKFDPAFFGILPVDAESMDPQERLFLQVAWSCVEDAGYKVSKLSNENIIGVYVGVMYGEYQFIGVQELLEGKINVTSSSYASIANRTSYQLNFRGPSIAVDTMCSSSLTTIHLACQSLRNKECEYAIAGGVNVSVHPYKYAMLGKLNFTSTDGRCRSFGEGGDGYVPGEGVGAVLLKPLSKAIEDRDNIYAIIKGSSINHGGKTNGYSVPNPKAHTELILRAMEETNINPRDISYCEAHGTGTSLGDPIEIAGISKAFEKYTNDKQFCSIGSIKSNIGHLEGAAGVAAVTKVLLQFKNQCIVPSLHSKNINSKIDFKNTPFFVPQINTKWVNDKNEHSKIATISSFGAGGSNAFMILEEYKHHDGTNYNVMQDKPFIFILSAKKEDNLKEYAKSYILFLNNIKPDDEVKWLLDMTFTLSSGRECFNKRLAVIFKTKNELIESLKNYYDQVEDKKVIFTKTAEDNNMNKLSETAKSALTNVLIQENSIDNLAELWVSGLNVDFTTYYSDVICDKVSLPTYPFSKNRLWKDGYSPIELEIKQNVASVQEHEVISNTKLMPEQTITNNPSKTANITESNQLTIEDRLYEKLSEIFTSKLKLVDKLQLTDSLLDLGLDSISATELINTINSSFKITIPPTVLFEFKSAKDLAKYLLNQHKDAVVNLLSGNAIETVYEVASESKSNINISKATTLNIDDLWSQEEITTNQATSSSKDSNFDFPVQLMSIKSPDNKNIEFAIAGSGDIPILLLGGLLLPYTDWYFQWPILKDKCLMIMPHTPGCNASSFDATNFSLETIVSDIARIVDYLDIKDQMIVVGYSYGGILAQRYYFSHPKMVKALILANTVDSVKGRTLDSKNMLTEISQSKHALSIMASYPVDKLEKYNEIIKDFDTTDVLKNISVPVLLITSEKDTYTPPHFMESIIKNVVEVSHVQLKDSGHLAKSTNYAQFNDAISKFIDKIGNPSFVINIEPHTMPFKIASLDSLKKYVSESDVGNSLFVTNTAAKLGLLVNYLIYSESMQNSIPYLCTYMQTKEISVDVAIKISRHYMRITKPEAAGKVIFYDPNNYYRNYYNPLCVDGALESFVPNLFFKKNGWSVLDEIANNSDYVAVVLDLSEDFDHNVINRIQAIAKQNSITTIGINSLDAALSLSSADLECLSDIIILDQSIVENQMPLSVCAITEKVHAPWRKVPFEGIPRMGSCSYNFPMFYAVESLKNKIFNGSHNEILNMMAASDSDHNVTIELYAKYVNPGYIDVTKNYGWQWRFEKANGAYSYYKVENNPSVKVLDVFQSGGTALRGYNPTDLLDIANNHDVNIDYVAELQKLLSSKTGFDKLLLSQCTFSAIDLALQLVTLAIGSMPKVLGFIDGFGFTLMSSMLTRSSRAEFNNPYLPFNTTSIMIDPFAPDAAIILENTLKNEKPDLVWIETIRYTTGGYTSIPQNLLDIINNNKDACGYLIGIDENLTSGTTGELLNSKNKIHNPDLVTISACMSDSILPMGAVLTKTTLYDFSYTRNLYFLNNQCTFGGDQLLAHVALNSISHLYKDGLLDSSRELSNYFKGKLTALVAKHSVLNEVRGEGWSLALNFNLSNLPIFWQLNFCYLFWGACLRDAIFPVAISVVPLSPDTIRFMPPLTANEHDIDLLIENLDRNLSKGIQVLIQETIDYLLKQGNERTANFYLKQLEGL